MRSQMRHAEDHTYARLRTSKGKHPKRPGERRDVALLDKSTAFRSEKVSWAFETTKCIGITAMYDR